MDWIRIVLIGAVGAGLVACGSDGGNSLASVPGPAEEVPVASQPIDSRQPEPTPPLTPESPGADGELDPEAPQVEAEVPPLGDSPIPDLTAAFPGLEGLPGSAHPADPLSGSLLEAFPLNLIVSGGVPKDGIPALTNPSFVGAARANYLQPGDLVLGMVVNGQAKAYPHNIGWWHEIINDRVGGHPVCVTFCPLTGTGLVYDGLASNGRQFELGVSGLLYNNNLIMYDRRDGRTLYPQIFSTAVEGPRQGESLTLLPVVETTWDTWRRLYPETQVVSGNTGFSRNYEVYPYSDYRVNHQYLIFGLEPALRQNPNDFARFYDSKDMVLGVRLNGDPKAYPFAALGDRQLVHDQVGDVDIVVVWDQAAQLAIPFAREVDGQVLDFDIDAEQGFPFSLIDRQTGSRWSSTGAAVEGPLAGHQLVQIPAHNSFWFAWVTFWQDTDLWLGQEG
ncbi:MAG: DUF3179 domain-containing protein [Candidatus Latescibacteria bacterium]|nr:DUF3179 domain-containing protein [Candidatus Latescibacterota bacterium]